MKVRWEERNSEAQAYYTQARENGKCKHCGEGDIYLKAGPHPSGRRGQPVRLAGPDVEAVRKWVEEAGFVCQRCSLTAATGGAKRTRQPTPRKELAKIRARLLPLRKAHQTPESCQVTLDYVLAHDGQSGVEAMKERVALTGAWIEPDEFRRLLAREQELTDSIK